MSTTRARRMNHGQGGARRDDRWLTWSAMMTQALMNTALDQFAIPGDASFPLNQAFEAPRDSQDAEILRQYEYQGGHA